MPESQTTPALAVMYMAEWHTYSLEVLKRKNGQHPNGSELPSTPSVEAALTCEGLLTMHTDEFKRQVLAALRKLYYEHSERNRRLRPLQWSWLVTSSGLASCNPAG